MNQVTLIGRLVRDPNLEYTQSGTAVCKFAIAVDRIKKEDGTDFIGITVWGKQAENCERFLAKGRQVCIQGRIQTGSYEKNGKKVYTTDVIAERVEFLSRPSGDDCASRPVEEPGFSEVEDEDIPF